MQRPAGSVWTHHEEKKAFTAKVPANRPPSMTKTHFMQWKIWERSALWAGQETSEGFSTLHIPAQPLGHLGSRGASTPGPKSFQLLTDNPCPRAWGKHLTYGEKKNPGLKKKKMDWKNRNLENVKSGLTNWIARLIKPHPMSPSILYLIIK